MKLKDLKTQEQLNLYVVSQQRELLIAFGEKIEKFMNHFPDEVDVYVDEFLKEKSNL